MRFLLFLSLSAAAAASAQVPELYIPWEKGNQTRSTENPLYWKNKAPHAGYWQQDVYYKINASLDDSAEVITGTLELTYYNNSPHTLTEAYFHLYQNSFTPGSLNHELYLRNHEKPQFGPYEEQGKGTEIVYLGVGGEAIDNYSIDYTVMRVPLPQALESGDSTTFQIWFKTYFDRGSLRRRMKVYDHHGIKHFNTVHWYPRICVYDPVFSWETTQHLEKEFYGDFGSYDVEINLPQEYVVEATGTLLNPEEAYPGDLRQRLDIKNFANKPIDEAPSIITPRTGARKSWRYHADNVHDFAWTADPSYRIGEVTWNGIQCIALAQENNAGGWQPTAQFVADVVRLYSEDFGLYEYPKMVAADAADGMEYPMLTLDGGHWPSHQGLIAHEVGHNWFFGMLGSNETYRASLDEGFTQFLTAWSMNALVKEPMAEYKRAFAGYMDDALDLEDPSLSTHSHDFNDAVGHGGGYRHVYYKTATMLYNLRYVLGDSLFRVAMQHYVADWKMCHPYPEDFRKSITDAVQTDLTWFFDGWMNDTRHIDYGVASVTKKSSRYTVTLQRLGDQIMPIDLQITYENGSVLPLTIPVSHFEKPERVSTGMWEAWGRLRPTYSIDLATEFPIAKIEIDPSQHLADVNRVNNVWEPGFDNGRLDLAFHHGQAEDKGYLGEYKALWRPALSYGGVEGFKPGLAWKSQYAGRRHVVDARLWYNSYSAKTPVVPAYPQAWASAPIGASAASPPLSYRFTWSHQVPKNGRYFLQSASQAGLFYNRFGWDMAVGEHTFGIDALSMRRYRFAEVGEAWSEGHNLSMNLFWNKAYQTFTGSGSWNVSSRLSSPFADASYGSVSFEWKHQQKLGKTQARLRYYGSMMAGSGIPAESMIYAAGANPEQRYENEFYRNMGMLSYTPDLWHKSLPPKRVFDYKYLQLGGGLNLRGYQGYALPYQDGDTVVSFARGTNGIAFNGEWDFFKTTVVRTDFKAYAFADAGIMGRPLSSFAQDKADGRVLLSSGLIADAGFGFLITPHIMHWGKPRTLRIDVPLFLSAVPNGQQHFQPRLVVGIGRSW